MDSDVQGDLLPPEVVFEGSESIVAGVETIGGPVGVLDAAVLERWTRWADEHDQFVSRLALLNAQLDADERAVDQELARAKGALQHTVNAAPSDIKRAWANAIRSEGELTPGPFRRSWAPGGLTQEIARARQTLDGSVSAINSGYHAVAKRSAVLRGSAVRSDLLPAYRRAKSFIGSLEVQRGPIRTIREQAREAHLTATKALASEACAELTALSRSHAVGLDQMAPTALDFDDARWGQWLAPTRVGEVLWYWQSVPLGLTAAVAASNDFSPQDVGEYQVVGDFRSVPGFLWWNARGDESAWAAASAQALVLRLMAAIPAGKARFTFIDPLGSGSNAAPFLGSPDGDVGHAAV